MSFLTNLPTCRQSLHTFLVSICILFPIFAYMPTCLQPLHTFLVFNVSYFQYLPTCRHACMPAASAYILGLYMSYISNICPLADMPACLQPLHTFMVFICLPFPIFAHLPTCLHACTPCIHSWSLYVLYFKYLPTCRHACMPAAPAYILGLYMSYISNICPPVALPACLHPFQISLTIVMQIDQITPAFSHIYFHLGTREGYT